MLKLSFTSLSKPPPAKVAYRRGNGNERKSPPVRPAEGLILAPERGGKGANLGLQHLPQHLSCRPSLRINAELTLNAAQLLEIFHSESDLMPRALLKILAVALGKITAVGDRAPP